MDLEISSLKVDGILTKSNQEIPDLSLSGCRIDRFHNGILTMVCLFTNNIFGRWQNIPTSVELRRNIRAWRNFIRWLVGNRVDILKTSFAIVLNLKWFTAQKMLGTLNDNKIKTTDTSSWCLFINSLAFPWFSKEAGNWEWTSIYTVQWLKPLKIFRRDSQKEKDVCQ